MLELQTGDGIEEDPSEQEDLFGGTHPQAFSLGGGGDHREERESPGSVTEQQQ